MARKQRVQIAEQVRTLLELYESFKRDYPDKLRWMEEQRRIQNQKLFGKLDEDPYITELHNVVEKRYKQAQGLGYDGPPLLHIRLQYAGAVKQSRYEASVFSNIIHEADNLVDTVTGDEDDSDYETLVDVGKSGGLGDGIMSGLGLGKGKAVPELRILVLKVTNIDKICTGKIQQGRVSVTYEKQKKSYREKSLKKEPDHRHRIGFHHVFNYRGLPIQNYDDTDIKIEVKMYTEDTQHKAHVILSPDGCAMAEVDRKFQDKCETSTTLWKDYLDKATEDIVEYVLPLISGPPETLEKRGRKTSSTDKIKALKKDKTTSSTEKTNELKKDKITSSTEKIKQPKKKSHKKRDIMGLFS